MVSIVTHDGNRPTGLKHLLAEIETIKGCSVEPPNGESVAVAAHHQIPDDLRELHRLCARIRLHKGTHYPWSVSGPSDLVPAGPLLLTPEEAARASSESPLDPVNSCYVIARDSPDRVSGQWVVVDLHPERTGRCCLTAWDTFGLVDEMPIVATSVRQLLQWLLCLAGDNPMAHLPALGDAYDAIG
ncbi:hypothetical protein [Streptomyces brasiliensis]|uniref:Knr4/Smi1-like domain-containing protein n=1 Tax=Streptomyces brasiliensis TaxID=1954 RepID=A0A917P1G4_9ACTN|nr:hypothetical protein [Streptomyces brasiliensis]GGJ50525.1 hypothetical protein GCM10010121_071900 [Streptomyces brasiliensis]